MNSKVHSKNLTKINKIVIFSSFFIFNDKISALKSEQPINLLYFFQ